MSSDQLLGLFDELSEQERLEQEELQDEELREQLRQLNAQLEELNARAGAVESERESVKLKLRDVAKELQQQQTDRTWHEIGLGADKKRRIRRKSNG